MPIFSVLFFPFFPFHPIVWLVSLLLYFLPAFLARNKPNFTGVLILNLLAGWTFIGWIIALVWALSGPSQGQAVIPPQPVATAPTPPLAGATYFCSACGKPCAAGASFCASCGAPLPTRR